MKAPTEAWNDCQYLGVSHAGAARNDYLKYEVPVDGGVARLRYYHNRTTSQGKWHVDADLQGGEKLKRWCAAFVLVRSIVDSLRTTRNSEGTGV